MLGGVGHSRAPVARFWLTLDLGYAFAGASTMRFAQPSGEEDPRHFGAVTLPDLRPSGVVSRLAASVSF